MDFLRQEYSLREQVRSYGLRPESRADFCMTSLREQSGSPPRSLLRPSVRIKSGLGYDECSHRGPSRMGVGLEQVMQFHELLRQFVPWVEVDQRQVGLMRLAHFYRGVEVHRQHRQAFGNQFVEH